MLPVKTTHSNIVVYNRVPKCGSTTTLKLLGKLSVLHNFTLMNHIKPKELHYIENQQVEAELLNEISSLMRNNAPSIYIRHLHFYNFEENSNLPMPKYRVGCKITNLVFLFNFPS